MPASPDAPAVDGFERRRRRTRRAIVDAAIELFQTRGVQHTSLDEICAQAEVSARTFFNHFETRAHLHDVIAEQRAEQTAAVLRDLADAPGPFAQRLSTFFEAVAGYLAERPAYRDFVGEMLQRHPARGSAVVRGGSLSEAAQRFVQRGVDDGEVRGDLPTAVLADLMTGTVTTLVANWSASERFDVRAEGAAAAHVLVTLLGPPRRRTP